MEFGQFCRGEPQNFANGPAEFGKIFRGKLWALTISSEHNTCHVLQIKNAENSPSQKYTNSHFRPGLWMPYRQ